GRSAADADDAVGRQIFVGIYPGAGSGGRLLHTRGAGGIAQRLLCGSRHYDGAQQQRASEPNPKNLFQHEVTFASEHGNFTSFYLYSSFFPAGNRPRKPGGYGGFGP